MWRIEWCLDKTRLLKILFCLLLIPVSFCGRESSDSPPRSPVAESLCSMAEIHVHYEGSSECTYLCGLHNHGLLLLILF